MRFSNLNWNYNSKPSDRLRLEAMARQTKVDTAPDSIEIKNDFEMAIGDVNSKEMGTAARANGGKARWELMSFSQIYKLMQARHTIYTMTNGISDADMFAHLAGFQTGQTSADDLLNASVAYNWKKQIMGRIRENGSNAITLMGSLENVIKVWDYGLKKYAEFNWATGMPWSACMACIARHVRYHYEGNDIDDESEELHSAHVVCNAMMLVHYAEYWVEGDDRPLFAFKKKDD